MRKTSFISYIVLTAMAVTTVSCSLHESDLDQSGRLSLEFKCAELLTRADDPETAIESIDYFLYTSLTGAAVYHNRINSTSTTVVLDDVSSLAQAGQTCYVYAVANLPSSISLTGAETIADLQAISVTTDFTAAQTSFVMDSKEAVTTSVGSSATVPLHRLAAKLTMTVNIPASIESGATTYVPDYGHIRIYYVNAAKKGTFDGSYMTYGDSASEDANKDYYFLYPYDWPVSVTAGSEESYVGTTVTPFYTYPESWEPEEVHEPYFKVILPWAASGESSNSKPYYYKVIIPNSFNGKIDRNTFYKFVLDIGVLGSEVDDGSVEISGDYYVVDWNKAFTVGGDEGDEALTKGKYLSVAQTEYAIYAEDGITIHVISSHNVNAVVTSAKYTDFSGNTPVERELQSGYSINAIGRESITLIHDLDTDITSNSLDCSIYEFTITISNEAGCPTQIVKVTQYPSLYITSEDPNRKVFINNWSNREIGNTNNYTINDDGGIASIESDEYNCSFNNNNNSYSHNGVNITFTRVSSVTGGKRFGNNQGSGIMTITPPEGGSITGLTINYYNDRNNQSVTYNPAGENPSKTRWSGTVSSGSSLTVTMPRGNSNNTANVVSSITVDYTYVDGAGPETLGSIRNYNYTNYSGNSNFNIYTINVSNLSGNDRGWYIADPRSTSTVDMPMLRGRSADPSDQLTGYRPVGADAAGAIAPQFKIASSAGASLGQAVNYEQATRRCAAYQENGYPAGRWRVPTPAEIQFVISLSNVGKIQPLFNYNYWAAGRVIVNQQGNVDTNPDANTTGSVRCVYDSWYWGDEKMNEDEWNGFQTD